MEEKIFSTYSVIPTEVMLNKGISSTAKVLYGLISSLCNEKGYCWASNDYLGLQLGITGTRVSLLVKELIDSELIKSTVEGNNSRIITLNMVLTKVKATFNKTERLPLTKVKHNIISNNINEKLEPAAQEDEIRYTSLEDEVRGLKKPPKVDDPNLTERRSIIGYFIRRSKEVHNYCPQIALIPALKLVKDLQTYNKEEDLRGLVDWFLESEMYDKLGSDIKICFSLASYNKYMDFRRKH